MTINHHPSDELMLDYAVGSLGPAAELAIATHMTFCPLCRGTDRLLDSVGGHFLAESVESPIIEGAFEAIAARVAENSPVPRVAASPKVAVFPQPLREAIGCDLDAVPWQRLGMGAYQCLVPMRDPAATARLLRIPAGRPVPVHTHRGTELTLVLRGAFSDATGTFGTGDLQEADDSLVHQPHAAAAEDCICLAVTQAPLRFKSWAARLVQPFLGI